MGKPSLPLITLSEAQRRQALERFAVLRADLQEGVSRTQIARYRQMSLSTVQRWIKSYREKGLAGLAPAPGGARVAGQQTPGGHKRSGRDGSPEPHHWAWLNQSPMVRYLKIVRSFAEKEKGIRDPARRNEQGARADE